MDRKLHKLCVFCGSSFGQGEKYLNKTQELGRYMAENSIELIYGGGNVGLMGELARTVLKGGGKVIGVIPKKIYENVQHVELTQLYIVEDMHERKAKMYSLADGFIGLPGGIGTLEEVSEIYTWYQLGYHKKPIGLLNIENFYDPFLKLLQHMIKEDFLDEAYLQALAIEKEPKVLIKAMESHEPFYHKKWK